MTFLHCKCQTVKGHECVFHYGLLNLKTPAGNGVYTDFSLKCLTCVGRMTMQYFKPPPVNVIMGKLDGENERVFDREKNKASSCRTVTLEEINSSNVTVRQEEPPLTSLLYVTAHLLCS